MKIGNKNHGYIILLTAVFSWSFSEIIVKLLQSNVGVLSLSFFRFFIGGLFLFLILLIRNDLKGIRKIIRNNLPIFLISSCFVLGFSNIIYFIGVTYTEANIAAAIYTTYPIWITIYSIFILNERENLKFKFIGIIFGIIGATILITQFNFAGFVSLEYLWGNFLVLSGSIIWSLYSVLGKKIQLVEHNITNYALKYGMLTSLFACIPIIFFLIYSSDIKYFFNYQLYEWFWIFFLGIICTGFGIWLLFEGISRLEVSKGMSFAFLKPIFASILSFFILSEIPSPILIISIAIIIISIFLINKNTDSHKEEFSNFFK
ncbi:MAG: DMT family transporter [Candidatus Lokiarchaeota archaeon]|nr:DMT family transporter [Candidatus Lokiarchaeota archaeon]